MKIVTGKHHIHFVFPGYEEFIETHVPNGEHWLGELVVAMLMDTSELVLSIRIDRAMFEETFEPKINYDKYNGMVHLIWKDVDAKDLSPIPDRLKSDRKNVSVKTYKMQGSHQRMLSSLEIPFDLLPLWEISKL